MRRKRPCCICRRWFWPDPRVGSRQVTCGLPECQRELHRRCSARQRRRDRNDEKAHRIECSVRKKMAGLSPVVVEQEKGSGVGIGREQIRAMTREEMRAQLPAIIALIYTVLPFAPKEKIKPEAPVIIDRFGTQIQSAVREEIARVLPMPYRSQQEGANASRVSPSGP